MPKARFIFTIVAISLVVISLVSACSSSQTATQAPKTTAPQTSTQAPQPTAAAPATTAVSQPSTSAAPAANAKILRLAWFGAPDKDAGLFIGQAIDQFNKQFGDKVTIKYFPLQSLVTLLESMDAVRTGAAEIAIYPVDAMGAKEKSFNFAGQPMLYNNVQANTDGVKALLPDYSKVMEQKFNQKMIGGFTLGGIELCSSKKQIKAFDDAKGLLLSAISPSTVKMATAMGASAINVATQDTYSAFQKGTIDASLQTITGMLQNKWYDVAPNVTIGYFVPNMMGVTINLDTYNSLPKDVQDGISALGKYITDKCNEYYVKEGYPGSIDKLSAAGAKVIKLVPAERAKFLNAITPTNEADFTAAGDFGKRVKEVATQVNQTNPYTGN